MAIEGLATVDFGAGLLDWLGAEAAKAGVSRDGFIRDVLGRYRDASIIAGELPLFTDADLDRWLENGPGAARRYACDPGE